jgi:hypothetical protein
MDFLTEVFPVLATLAGFPAVLAAVINLAKVFGLPDGQSTQVMTYAYLLAFVGVFIALALGKLPLVTAIDAELSKIALFLLSFAVFATEVGLTKLFHQALRGVPFIGKSYSLEREKEELEVQG